MAYALKTNEDDARARLRAFWAGGSLGRPALYVTARNTAYHPEVWPAPAMDRRRRDLDPAWHVHVARERLYSQHYLAEAMPAAWSIYGGSLAMLPQLAGGTYGYDDNGVAWVEPLDDLYARPLPAFDPQHPVVVAQTEALRAIAAAVGRDGYVNPPIMGLDSLTALSLLRGADQLCLDLLEDPAPVRAWSEALLHTYLDCCRYFYGVVRALGYGESSTWLQAMAEGHFDAAQCDFGVMLSPDMYAEFVMPDLRRVTEYFTCSLYHLDGTCQMRFIDQLASLPRLNGIQWNPEPGAGSPVAWLDAFREIRQRGLCLHIWADVEEAMAITRALGPDGLLLSLPRFATEAEAEAAIARIAAAC